MAVEASSEKGFLRSLFDFSFTSFITTRIVKTLYVIITIVYTLVAIGAFIALISRGGSDIAIAVIGVPIVYVLYLALARVSLEFIAVVFRIAEYARDIRDQGRGQVAGSGGWIPGSSEGPGPSST